jgi:hypothetical protein
MVECTWVRELLLTRRAIAVLGTCASQSNSCGSVSSYESRSTQLKGMWIVHALHCLPAGRRCVGLALAAVTPLHASIQFAGWLGMQRSNWGSARSASACMVGWFISEIFRFPFFCTYNMHGRLRLRVAGPVRGSVTVARNSMRPSTY